MQPKTLVKLNKDAFERIKKTAKNMSISSKAMKEKGCFATPLPEEIGLQLTNRCNLRCKHCFEWNTEGYNWDLSEDEQKGELSYKIIEQVLFKTEEVKSNLFLWGGEPMVYNHWDRLCEDLANYKRWTVLCTNGILVKEKIDSLVKMSDNLAILTSVEGFEEENDAIRGKGSYKKVMGGIDEVLYLQKDGVFKGLQSIHITVNNDMIGKLYNFMEFCEDKLIDTVYFCFPWYIPIEVSYRMDEYFKKHFSWLLEIESKKASWHSFKFKIDEDKIEQTVKDLERIVNRKWKIRVRFQPALELSQIPDYLRGSVTRAQNKNQCLAVCNRMDIMADGSVSSCKLFSEFNVGNLHDNSLEELWNCDNFNKVRAHLSKELMPVCSKCILLYLNGK